MLKRFLLILMALLSMPLIHAQQFVATDIIPPNELSEQKIQNMRKEVIGVEINLLFSDNDVRLTMKPKKGKTESYLLSKIGSNLYRLDDHSGNEVVELELNTTLGYIRSCKLSVYDKKRKSSSMVFNGAIIFKRK